ncbi:putative Fe-S oxidoreductase [Beggiatoa alba B18LD]|uniref:Putative Fe-S oxidoreductase n=1 Tax=Beggiatoa alba B18LD TaxID=395493 RepID=I3CCD0_9GAMM|nr:arsenosugar biosynthesis radical SAM (seleno)protein ArsS [Beggiatoa alba]EIJ41273.1 putative Fe-S oxidoreductase [Beggiatoa alba B18LD]
MLATLPLLQQTDFPAITRRQLETVQVNLGYRCNQRCLHCHVNASPTRQESMSRETIEQVLQYLKTAGASTLDLTGGAPELNPHFRWLVIQARQQGIKVIDRCNLTILFEPEQTDLAEFLAGQQVEIVASLPCYLAENVDKQRGVGTFEKSIAGLQRLNQLGYGHAGSALQLNLVFNPLDTYLPPAQQTLEADYKKILFENYGIVFNQLYTLCNMPIQRFGSSLLSKGQFQDYMQCLKQAFQVENLARVMCRQLISIDWQGYVYDCDFNQMLGLPLYRQGRKQHIKDLTNQDLTNNPITIADHCYGCTAGQGSSCGGALS